MWALAIGAATAQEPMWQSCRPKALPLEPAALFTRPLPPLRTASGASTPEQAIAGHRLVVDRDGWWLDGAVVTELGKLDATVVAVAADLPAPEVVRLLEALRLAGGQVWMVYAAPGRPPAGSRAPTDLPPVPKGGSEAPEGAPPGTVEAWSDVIDQCGPGKELVAPAPDCSTFDAKWREVTENPRCLLPSRLVRDIRGPVGVGTDLGIAVEPFALDPAHEAWLGRDQTWADLEPGAGWAKLGSPPWGAGPPRVDDLVARIRNRVTPAWPDGASKKKKVVAATCDARVTIERDGRPSAVEVTGCDAPFVASVTAALSAWEWYPPVFGGFGRKVSTGFTLTFQDGTVTAVPAP